MLCIHNHLEVRRSSSKQELQRGVHCLGCEHAAAKVRGTLLSPACSESSFLLSLDWHGDNNSAVIKFPSPCNVFSCVIPCLNQIPISLASVRNSVPHYLLYLLYWSFATQAMEMKLLTVDVLCQCEMFQFPGKRCCTGKTTSVGTAILWFYLHKSAKLTCFHWQNFLAGCWRNRGILH